jgi:hypothetical protein
MIKHVWTVPCRFALRDADTNNYSLIEVIESISSAAKGPPRDGGPPFLPVIIEVVSLWTREYDDKPATGQGRISLVSPAGNTIASSDQQIDLREHLGLRTTTRMVGFPLPVSGRYGIRTEMRLSDDDDWKLVSEAPVRVRLTSDTGAPSPVPPRASAE